MHSKNLNSLLISENNKNCLKYGMESSVNNLVLEGTSQKVVKTLS